MSLIIPERIYRFAPHLTRLPHKSKERLQKGRNSRNIIMSSGPGEGGCCSLVTKHDRRKASRAKLLISDRRLEK
jgi:hypothetical protein